MKSLARDSHLFPPCGSFCGWITALVPRAAVLFRKLNSHKSSLHPLAPRYLFPREDADLLWQTTHHTRRSTVRILFLIQLILSLSVVARANTPVQVVRDVQAKVAKIYGAGGLRGLESYQSGFLISPQGHVLTAWSYVLDVEPIIVVLKDGSRHEAKLHGFDPILEIAILKLEAETPDHFDLTKSVELRNGDRVLAFSNLYGVATGNEAASVQRGVVAMHAPLQLREGGPTLTYRGPIYLIDAMTNNAGAAGGVLTDWHGNVAGILGKEIRHEATNIWVNYALPIVDIRPSIDALLAGKQAPQLVTPESAPLPDHFWSLNAAGIRLVPNALPQTPPYVEVVMPGSSGQSAGIRPDDLITFVGQTLIRSQNELLETLRKLPDHEPLTLLVLRDQALVTVQLAPPK